MIEIASKMILCLAIAALIGFFIGLIVGRITREKSSSIYNHNQDFKVYGNIYNRPIILSKPRPTGKDDLKLIEGIDAKIENDLNQLGIFHFDQISKWSTKNSQWVSEYFSLENKIEEDRWIGQASELANKNKASK